MIPTDNTWIAVDADYWHFARWDDEPEWAFFNAGSGETLLLNDTGGRVLQALVDGPQSERELAERLGPTELDADQWRAEVAEALRAFWKVRLVQPLKP